MSAEADRDLDCMGCRFGECGFFYRVPEDGGLQSALRVLSFLLLFERLRWARSIVPLRDCLGDFADGWDCRPCHFVLGLSGFRVQLSALGGLQVLPVCVFRTLCFFLSACRWVAVCTPRACGQVLCWRFLFPGEPEGGAG